MKNSNAKQCVKLESVIEDLSKKYTAPLSSFLSEQSCFGEAGEGQCS